MQAYIYRYESRQPQSQQARSDGWLAEVADVTVLRTLSYAACLKVLLKLSNALVTGSRTDATTTNGCTGVATSSSGRTVHAASQS